MNQKRVLGTGPSLSCGRELTSAGGPHTGEAWASWETGSVPILGYGQQLLARPDDPGRGILVGTRIEHARRPTWAKLTNIQAHEITEYSYL